MGIRLRGQGADKRHHPKKSIPCSSQVIGPLKPLSTNGFRESTISKFRSLATPIIRHRKQRLRIGAGNFQQRARRLQQSRLRLGFTGDIYANNNIPLTE